MKKRKLIWGLIKRLIRNSIFLVVGSLYTLYIVVRFINNLVSQVFMSLPRILRVVTIYTLVLTAAVSYFKAISVKAVEVEVIKEVEVVVEKIVEVEKETKVEEPKEEAKKCNLGNEVACTIYNRAIEKGLTKEQALIVVSISRHETGNWTSNAYKTRHNFGGVMCSSGLKTYSSFDEGLNGFINLLKTYYFGKGLNTIEKIGNKYCPVGASNDPTGVNKYWIPNVTKYYNEYLKK